MFCSAVGQVPVCCCACAHLCPLTDGPSPAPSARHQIHDELVFDVDESLLQPAAQAVRRVMEGAAAEWGLRVALPVNIKVGLGLLWGAALQRVHARVCVACISVDGAPCPLYPRTRLLALELELAACTLFCLVPGRFSPATQTLAQRAHSQVGPSWGELQPYDPETGQVITSQAGRGGAGAGCADDDDDDDDMASLAVAADDVMMTGGAAAGDGDGDAPAPMAEDEAE